MSVVDGLVTEQLKKQSNYQLQQQQLQLEVLHQQGWDVDSTRQAVGRRRQNQKPSIPGSSSSSSSGSSSSSSRSVDKIRKPKEARSVASKTGTKKMLPKLKFGSMFGNKNNNNNSSKTKNPKKKFASRQPWKSK